MDELLGFGIERSTGMNLLEVRRIVLVCPEVWLSLGEIWHVQQATIVRMLIRSIVRAGVRTTLVTLRLTAG
jgi:hypothetical protein